MPARTTDPGIVRRVRYLVEARTFDLLSALALRVSPSTRQAIADGLGTIYWAIDARHRRIGVDNVSRAYAGTMTSREVSHLVRSSMRHFARLAMETLAFSQYMDTALETSVRVEGLDHLRSACASGQGVIGITGHVGHWEMLPMLTARLGMPMTAVARPLDNPHLDARLRQLRTIAGGRVISRRGAFPEALAVLQHGGFLGLVIDQRPKRGGHVVPFFGRDAHTTDGVARLALASSANILPACAVREDDGVIRLWFDSLLPVVRTRDAVEDAHRITAASTAAIEKFVRQYPEQYLWTHRRWATPRFAARPIDAGRGA